MLSKLFRNLKNFSKLTSSIACLDTFAVRKIQCQYRWNFPQTFTLGRLRTTSLIEWLVASAHFIWTSVGPKLLATFFPSFIVAVSDRQQQQDGSCGEGGRRGDKDKDSVAARSNRYVCACLLPGGCSSISICSRSQIKMQQSQKEQRGSQKEVRNEWEVRGGGVAAAGDSWLAGWQKLWQLICKQATRLVA